MPSDAPRNDAPLPASISAFADGRKVASGTPPDVMAALRAWRDGAPGVADADPAHELRVFDDATGARLPDLEHPPFDFEHHDNPAAVPAPRSVGRPRLGVVAREVTLLPRHWDWLNRQPGGASVALRRLVDEARHVPPERDAVRAAREAGYSFMIEVAGQMPHFEEAARALFAGDRVHFESHMSAWPNDVQAYLRQLTRSAF